MRLALFLTLSFVTSLALAEGTTDPEAQANQNLGNKAAASGSAASAAQPPTNDPSYEPPRATPVAKDLSPDDVVVQEIHTQGTPPSSAGKTKAKKQVRPSDDDGDGTARDTETEVRGSEQIAPHEATSPSEASDTAHENSEAADQMQMSMHPVKDSANEADAEATPAPKQKPKRAQKGAVAAASGKMAKKVDKKTAAKNSKAAAKEEKVAATAEAAPTADTVLKWLANGNTRFVKKNLRADGKSPADRLRLVKGEHPHAAILAAADSRVVPEIIFDQALGEVYDVRAFGEDLDSATVAALEYAVAKLKVPVIVVVGNSDCSAMKTMVEDKINENGDHVGDGITSPDIEKVISDIKPRLKTLKDDPVSPGYEVEATLNADGIARELVKRSDIIREAVEKNELVIKSALYRLDSGKVSFY